MGGPTTGNAPQLLGGTAIKPKERKGFEAIRYFIHNPETGEFFTRTPKSWALIIIFYIIYYSCLAGIWYGLLTAYFSTLPDARPKFTLGESLIGDNPGLGLRPSQPYDHIDSSMVKLKYNAKNEKPTEDGFANIDWAERAKDFMDQYNDLNNTIVCDEESHKDGEVACRFDPSTFGPCANFPYGYEIEDEQSVVTPCVFIKPNRIFDWVPKPYDLEAIEGDDQIPENIKEKIKMDNQKLYVNCEGENPFDREGLEGKIKYFPEDQAIDFKYFPYIQVDSNYHNPAVAVKIEDPEVGRLYHIECRLYGANVLHHRKDRKGLVHFELYLD